MKIESVDAIPFTIPLAAPTTFSHAGISAAAGHIAPLRAHPPGQAIGPAPVLPGDGSAVGGAAVAAAVDQRVQQAGDVLQACRGGIELAAQGGESGARLVPQAGHFGA